MWPREMRRLNRRGTAPGSPLDRQAPMSVLNVSVDGTTPAIPMLRSVARASCANVVQHYFNLQGLLSKIVY